MLDSAVEDDARGSRRGAGGGRRPGTSWSRFRAVALLALAVGATVLPLTGIDSAQRFLLAYMVIVCLLAVSLHFLMGVAGLFSLGQAAFFGVGAYTGVLLMDRAGLDGVLALPLVALAGAAVGGLMALATLRSSDLYLALTTLAFGFIGENVVRNLDTVGGAQGLTGFDLQFGGTRLDQANVIYWVGLACLLVLMLAVVSMRRSRIGRALMAARESPVAAKSIGVNTVLYRYFAFALSGAFSAVAGALYTAYALVLDPSVFGLGLTISVLTIAIVGGLRSLPGVVLTAIALTYFRNSADQFGVSEYVLLVYGGLVVLVLLFMPQGISGLSAAAVRRVAGHRRPASQPQGASS